MMEVASGKCAHGKQLGLLCRLVRKLALLVQCFLQRLVICMDGMSERTRQADFDIHATFCCVICILTCDIH